MTRIALGPGSILSPVPFHRLRIITPGIASNTDLYDRPAIRHAVTRASNAGRPLLLLVNHICIRVNRVIRGEVISAFPRRVFGKRDLRATGPNADRA
jgi:hypothetical protein